ncbi:DUF4253 domain-containing protein [Streptomyces sp. NPDC001787]|uniref:DUF4253 domain-containing protein n=1 Tax=Streptomyces sp. NPDC001787 TaxID=3154523 RepID=UPI00331D47E4
MIALRSLPCHGRQQLTAAGWAGPCNYDKETVEFSAVVRDWEHRFGVCAVAVGFSTLHLSVASPPMDEHEALLVADEYFASGGTDPLPG